MKTIDVDAKAWFDKVNGNSYFAGVVTVDYGMETEKRLLMPFQYGYGSQYEYEALNVLKKEGFVSDEIGSLWELRDKGIILRLNKESNCLKRELRQLESNHFLLAMVETGN